MNKTEKILKIFKEEVEKREALSVNYYYETGISIKIEKTKILNIWGERLKFHIDSISWMGDRTWEIKEEEEARKIINRLLDRSILYYKRCIEEREELRKKYMYNN